MTYERWGRLARVTLLLTVLPAVVGGLGGAVAFVLSPGARPALVVGAAFAWGLLLFGPAQLCVRAHGRALRAATAGALGLSYADHRAAGELEGVLVCTEVLRTAGRYGGWGAFWRLVPRGAAVGCHVHPTRRSARLVVDEPRVWTGDAGFDARFAVYAGSAEAARGFLDAGRRALLTQLDDGLPSRAWWLRPDGLVVDHGRELEDDAEAGAALLRGMVGWARALFAPR